MKERLRPYLLDELIYFFLYGGVVIPSGLKPLFTLRAVAPLALQDLPSELVCRLARALLSSDEGRKARGLQLLHHSLRVRLDLEGPDLNLVEVSDLHHIGVEAFRLDLSQHGVCICLRLKSARLDAIQASRRLFRRRLDICTPKAFVDLRGNLGVPFVEVCTGAALIRKPTVHGHVLLVRLTDIVGSSPITYGWYYFVVGVGAVGMILNFILLIVDRFADLFAKKGKEEVTA